MIGAEHSPGFETTTGSLAQALSTAGGIALGRRLKDETGRTFVFMSDGEFQEGQTWEASKPLRTTDSIRFARSSTSIARSVTGRWTR
jgi:transketolase